MMMHFVWVVCPLAMVLLNSSCLFVLVNGTGKGNAIGGGTAKAMPNRGGSADPSTSTDDTPKKGTKSSSSTTLAELFAKQDTPHTLADWLEKPQSLTLADLLAEEKQNNKKDGIIAAAEEDGIEEEEFNEMMYEMKNNEILIGEIFESNQQNGGGHLQQKQPKNRNENWLARKMRIFQVISKVSDKKRQKELEEKATKLIEIKEKDQPMSQIMETLNAYIKTIKSKHTFGPFKPYFSFIIKFCALRQRIQIDKIVPFKNMGKRQIIVKLKEHWKKGQKSAKNEEKSENESSDGKSNKSGNERILRLFYTAAEQIDGNAQLATKIAKKSNGRRRKKRFLAEIFLAIFTTLFIIWLIKFLINRLYSCLHSYEATDAIQPRTSQTVFQLQLWMSQPNNQPNNNAIKEGSDVESRIALFRTVPQKQIDAPKEGEEKPVCAVCLIKFELDKKFRPLTACKHVFHDVCIELWLNGNNTTCPLCRAEQFEIEDGKVVLNYGKKSPQTNDGTANESSQTNDRTANESPQTNDGTANESSQTNDRTANESPQTNDGTANESLQTNDGTANESSQTNDGTFNSANETPRTRDDTPN